jgi:hypothetical protein
MPGDFNNVWVPTLWGCFLTGYEGSGNWGSKIAKKYDQKGEFFKGVELETVGGITARTTNKLKVNDITPRTNLLQNIPYDLAMGIDVEDIDRDTIGIYSTKAAEIGAKFLDHPTKLICNLILTNPTCFDGNAFFSATHPAASLSGAASNNINLLTSSQIGALDVGTAAAPTILEMVNIIVNVVGYMQTYTDLAGDPLNLDARGYSIATSNPVIGAAIAGALGSLQLTSGQTNLLAVLTAINSPLVPKVKLMTADSMNAKSYTYDYAVDPRLGLPTSTDLFFFRNDAPVMPFLWVEEKPPANEILGPGSDSWVKENTGVWKVKAVRTVGAGRYQFAAKVTLS